VDHGPDGDNEDDVVTDLPFATRVDSALALDDAFAVGGLSTEKKATEAFVGWVPLDGSPGRRVGLGTVHGDVDPPLVAGRGRSVVVAVSDMDAGGGMLRLHRLDEGADKASGDVSITGVEHDAGSALAAAEQGALLVWGAKRAQGVGLKVASLNQSGPLVAPAPRELDGTLGAESPALVARPGGFWLAWVSEQPSAGERRDAGARPATPRSVTAGRADAGADAGPDGEEGPLIDAGARVLVVLPLDGAGKPTGSPRSVTAANAHVVGFEAALLPGGALALTWREDDASPGAESGPPVLARVALDGAIQRGTLEDEDLTAGLPALLAEPSASGRVWVALESASGGTRVGVVKESGLGLELLVGDPLLRGADVLAAGAGKLLVSRSRGRAVELAVLECKPVP
jgi:hypothetical protein